MRLYLAGSSVEHRRIDQVARQLTDWGHLVVSTWHRKIDMELEGRTDDRLLTDEPGLWQEPVEHALAEIRAAQAMVLFTGGPSRGGRHFEFGYAAALGLHTIIIGPREHLFHTLVCEGYATVGEWLATMPEWEWETEGEVVWLHGRP